MNFIRVYIVAVIIVIAGVILIGSLTGCKTVRYVEREKVVYDSSAAQEVIRLKAANSKLQSQLLLQKKDSSGITVEFQNCPQVPGQPVYLPGKIVVDKDGTLRAEGALKSVQISNQQLVDSNHYLRQENDSLINELSNNKIKVVAEASSETKYKKTTWNPPWWLLVAAFVIGCVFWHFRYRIPLIGSLLKFINGRFFNST